MKPDPKLRAAYLTTNNNRLFLKAFFDYGFLGFPEYCNHTKFAFEMQSSHMLFNVDNFLPSKIWNFAKLYGKNRRIAQNESSETSYMADQFTMISDIAHDYQKLRNDQLVHVHLYDDIISLC